MTVKTHLMLTVPIVLFIWIAFRIMFRVIMNSPRRGIDSVALDTWGIFLATNSSIKVHNRPERVMHANALLLSNLITNIALALLFNYMMALHKQGGLDTLKELGESGMDVLVSDELKLTMDEWTHNLE